MTVSVRYLVDDVGVAVEFYRDRLGFTVDMHRLGQRPPGLPGSDSAFAIVTHCLGVTEWWIGMQIAGRPVRRDRDAEFAATGTCDSLAGAVAAAKSLLRDDLSGQDLAEPINDVDRYPDHDPAPHWTKAAALIHTLEELAQHHGHLDLTRDLLRA